MYRVRTTFGGFAGSPYLSTMYFADPDGVLDTVHAQNCVDAVAAFWGAVDANLHSSLTWVTEAEVAVLQPLTGDQTDSIPTTPANGVGGQTGGQAAHATQGLVRWGTGVWVAGRQIRGRTYIPGIAVARMSSSGLPDSTFTTATATAANALLADADAPLGVWSKKNGTFNEAVSASVWSEFAVLRSRRD